MQWETFVLHARVPGEGRTEGRRDGGTDSCTLWQNRREMVGWFSSPLAAEAPHELHAAQRKEICFRLFLPSVTHRGGSDVTHLR